MSRLLARLTDEILILDGAMGTELQKRNLKTEDCPEKINLTNPDGLKQIHKDYLAAGSDIIQTNTFGANRLKLAEYGLEAKTATINRRAAEIAGSTTNQDQFVSGSIGPTGRLIAPLGELSFDTAYSVFAQQATALAAGGVDIINIETMTDLQEARAALIAVQEVTSLPVICNLSYEDNKKTVTGTDPKTAITVLEAIGADIIGANCSLGPQRLVEIIETMGQETDTYLAVQPNAGLPQLNQAGETIFPLEAAPMAEYLTDFIAAGANIIGGCCGSGPDYISLISQQAQEATPSQRSSDSTTTLASRKKRVKISDQQPTRIIGERINPSGREDLSTQLAEDNFQLVSQEAARQAEAGADILDVNLGVPEIDQTTAMKKALTTVQRTVDLPISIDTTDPEVLEAGLKSVVAKPLINSVTGEEESLTTVLPLAAKYGAAVLGLTLDEQGIPKTAKRRLTIAKKIVKRAKDYGIPTEDVLIDTLVLAASAEQESVWETLEGLRLIKEELGVATVLGISNISYGLPHRQNINQAYLAMAIKAGLNAPIMDPTEEQLKASLLASDLLANRDPGAKRYLDQVTTPDQATEEPNQADSSTEDILTQIYQLVLNGKQEAILSTVDNGLETYPAIEIINQALIPGIKEVGARYEEGTYFLPQLMQSAETMKEAFTKLKPLLEEDKESESAGRILLATVQGDIHDIGKNIVKIMFKNNNFEVIDLGKDVPNQQIVDKAEAEEVHLVALSALMTTTMPRMEEITKQLKESDLDCKVLLGGAVVTEEYTNNIGADGYAPNAVQAVQAAERLLQERSQ